MLISITFKPTHLKIMSNNGVYGRASGWGGGEGGEEHHTGHHTHAPTYH